jgi:glyoxylase-like metal-dependent hydrolase (beta-lactamase superfamily II)
MIRHFRAIAVCAAMAGVVPAHAAPDHVDITWMSIANMHFDLGGQQILADGYITRLPAEIFHGGNSGFAATYRASRPDTRAVREVYDAIGGKSAINLLLTGHSHFDHSFDTATWAEFSGARIIGSPTTCLQTRAAKIAAGRCTPVFGGEKFTLEPGVDMYVIRWNHSGDPARNPEQHNPVELGAMPVPDAAGALRAGLAEDFPNGGGNRAYLFTVDGPDGRFSWLFQDSASAVDLRERVVIDGKDFGAPLENLRAAMKAAGLESVDLWIATGGLAVAELVLPVLKPRAYLPVHWDGLFGAFKSGPPAPYSDAALDAVLVKQGVRQLVPEQYMDKWRLDRRGIHAVDNSAIKRKLGFN